MRTLFLSALALGLTTFLMGLLFTTVFSLLSANVAHAEPPRRPASFAVSPVRVELSNARRTGLVTIRNDEPRAARFQVTAWAWSQGKGGELQLEPTRDVSFFPSIFEVAPGQMRQLRIGVSLPATNRERTYRVIVEQLPSVGEHKAGVVQMLTRLSIPVFQAPTSGAPEVTLAAPKLSAGRVRFKLENTGAVHDMVKPVHLVGRDARGTPIVERTEPGWYLLAGSERLYDVELSADDCSRLRTLSLETATASQPLMSFDTFSTPSCSP